MPWLYSAPDSWAQVKSCPTRPGRGGGGARRADQTHAQDEETFAKALYKDDEAATLDDLREAVTALEEMERTARRAARARRRPRSHRELIPACVSRE